MNDLIHLHDEEWNKKRRELQGKVLAAAAELMRFSGAGAMSMDIGGIKVVIEVTRRDSDGLRRLQ